MGERVVVFATDLEGDIASGLALAGRLAVERAATLLLLHVIPLRAADGEGMLHVAADRGEADAWRRLRQVVPRDASVPYLHVVEVGDPEAVVIDVVRRERADLLVLEERKRSLVERALSRSFAERVVAQASCPVVVYRAGAEADRAGAPARRPRAVQRRQPLLDMSSARRGRHHRRPE